MSNLSPIAFLDVQVRAAARGDQEAFARLVDATRVLVCSIALAILRDVEPAAMSRRTSSSPPGGIWASCGTRSSPKIPAPSSGTGASGGSCAWQWSWVF